jgi:hypothetical protein
MRKPDHKLGISTALWFLLVLHVLGQGTQPRLVGTMNAIADALLMRPTPA